MEIWKDVPEYEGLYQVSNEGRVRSLVRLTTEATARGVRKEKCVLRFGSNKQGRLQVVLCKEGVTKRVQVHRLVLEAFVGACPEGHECRHGDGDHTNNFLYNLSWGTHTENMRDKTEHGTQLIGARAPNATLDEGAVRAIRASRETTRELAKKYGVSQCAISFIKTHKTWKHVL